MGDQTGADRALLLATQGGDGDAFGQFYRQRRALVLAYVRPRVRDAELAADLLAETFAAALSAIRDPARELPSEPVAWLMTIAHNKLIDSVRRGQVERSARLRLALEPLAVEDGDLQRIEEIVHETDLPRQLAELLPSDQYEALKARIFDEQEYSAIAGTLRCSQAVVRKRVSRALATLRGAMEAPE
jgi:RNA polymerase sigma factor (sigma-70 family)